MDRESLFLLTAMLFARFVKHLEHISDQEISQMEIPTGIPLIYKLDAAMHVVEPLFP